jgi:hypothetical protein
VRWHLSPVKNESLGTGPHAQRHLTSLTSSTHCGPDPSQVQRQIEALLSRQNAILAHLGMVNVLPGGLQSQGTAAVQPGGAASAVTPGVVPGHTSGTSDHPGTLLLDPAGQALGHSIGGWPLVFSCCCGHTLLGTQM